MKGGKRGKIKGGRKRKIKGGRKKKIKKRNLQRRGGKVSKKGGKIKKRRKKRTISENKVDFAEENTIRNFQTPQSSLGLYMERLPTR